VSLSEVRKTSVTFPVVLDLCISFSLLIILTHGCAMSQKIDFIELISQSAGLDGYLQVSLITSCKKTA